MITLAWFVIGGIMTVYPDVFSDNECEVWKKTIVPIVVLDILDFVIAYFVFA